jgi:hypothetical protein
MSESDLLELNCWLLGDDAQDGFGVNIPKIEKVSTLKEVIKDKNQQSLIHVDARCLALWKVSDQTLVTDRMLTRPLQGFHSRRQKF